jgi:hypothetical protein
VPLTATHVERITAFTEARIEEARASRVGQDDASRALRALDSVHSVIRARAELITPEPWPYPELDPDGQATRDHATRQKETAAAAWWELQLIARAWRDHPDYHPDFALSAHELPDAAADTPKEN